MIALINKVTGNLLILNKAATTKQHILAEALKMATQKSLNEVTIGELAKASDMSKSGLFAHFKSKENLQISVVDYASDLFIERVINPVSDISDPLKRLKMLASNWLDWYDGSARSCLFIIATAEFDDQPGPVRDALHHQQERWIVYLETVTYAIVESGQFQSDTDIHQFIFELYSLYLGSQKFYWLGKEDKQRTRFQNGLNRLIRQYLA